MPRITPETIIAPVIGIALLAALALGGVAFALSRHERRSGRRSCAICSAASAAFSRNDADRSSI